MRRSCRRGTRPAPPANPTLPAAHQRKGRETDPDPSERVGLRADLRQLTRASRGAPALSRALQLQATTRLPQPPTARVTADQRLWELQLGGLVGVELKAYARDLHLIARLEALGLQGADHADAAQATLEVAHRLVVLDVVAGEQPFDPPAADGEGARTDALDLEPGAAGGAEDHVLGEDLLALPGREARGRAGVGRGERRRDGLARRGAIDWRDHPHEQAPELLDAPAGGARGGDHRHVGAEQRTPALLRLGDRLLGEQVALGQREHPRQARQALIVGGELALDRGVVLERVRTDLP